MKATGTETARARRSLLRCAWFGCIAFAVLYPGHVTAQETSSPTTRAVFPFYLREIIQRGDSIDKARRNLLREFKDDDIDGNGVSRIDHELKRQLKAAAARARLIRDFFSKDLNGDGAIDRRELQIFHGRRSRRPIYDRGLPRPKTKKEIGQTLKILVNRDLEADKDGDGTITAAEIWSWANARKSSRKKDTLTRTIPLSMDADGNGTVSEAEFIRTVDRFLKIHDADRDGKISAEERARINRKNKQVKQVSRAARREARRRERMRRFRESCGFPRPAQNAQILLIGTNGGEALSTVSLGGDEVEVSVSDVWVEPGDQPLYVLLTSSDAMIWRFSGTVGRIAQVVASSYWPDGEGPRRVGVTGLPAARVYFVPNRDCLRSYSSPKSQRSRTTARKVSQLLGHVAVAVIGRSRVGKVNLPTGVFERKAVNPDAVKIVQSESSAPLWRYMHWKYRGGLVRIDPKAVVSPWPAKTYTLLPRYAGLAQLVDRGALRIIDPKQLKLSKGGHVSLISTNGRESWPETFLVLKKIRYPANLTPHMLFVVAPGVKTPEGSPGYSRTMRQRIHGNDTITIAPRGLHHLFRK